MPTATITGTFAIGIQSGMYSTPESVAGQNTDRMTWGTPPPGGSPKSYRFTGRTTEIPLDGSEFLLGTITHEDHPITDPPIQFDFTMTVRLSLPDGGGHDFRYPIVHSDRDYGDPGDPENASFDAQSRTRDTVDMGGGLYEPVITRLVPVDELERTSAVYAGAFWDFPPSGPGGSFWVMATMCLPSNNDARPRIDTVRYKGSAAGQADEYVEISNPYTGLVQLEGYRLSAGDSGQDFVFSHNDYLHGGHRLRVYTNEDHPEWGGHSFGIGRSIWNDKGEVAELRTARGDLVSRYAYGDQAATAEESAVPSDRLPAIAIVRRSGWVYTVLSGGRWVEFDDRRILRTGDIAGASGRWGAVLPPAFLRDAPVGGVVQDPATLSGGTGDPDIHVFVEGDDVVFVTDDALLEQDTISGRWPAVRNWAAAAPLQALAPARPTTGPVKYLALTGDEYCFFTDADLLESGRIAEKWPFLPAGFTRDIDAVALVPEAPRWKYLFAKGGDILFLTDAGIAEGPRRISAKWPHLWTWMQQGGR